MLTRLSRSMVFMISVAMFSAKVICSCEPLLLGGAGLGFVSDTEMAGLGLPRPILREHNPRHLETTHITSRRSAPRPIRNNPVREFHRAMLARAVNRGRGMLRGAITLFAECIGLRRVAPRLGLYSNLPTGRAIVQFFCTSNDYHLQRRLCDSFATLIAISPKRSPSWKPHQ